MIEATMERIEHLATGGTIDSLWNPADDTAVPANQSTVAAYYDFMAELGCEPVDSTTLMLLDSRKLTIERQLAVADRVAESAYRKIQVTSGTFLMPELSRKLSAHAMAPHFEQFDRRVNVAGALVPILGFEKSDGGFNLGMGRAVLEEDGVDDRVTASMNGSTVPAMSLEKEPASATFSSHVITDDVLGYDRYTVIPAGGTIDFEPDGLDGLVPAERSAIPDFLRDQVKTVKKFQAAPPILKDSRSLTNGDIDTVIDIIRASNDGHIIVTAGLIRMADLRQRINDGLKNPNDSERRVVLTGSRLMLRMAGMTDAPFNLGYAHGKLGFVEPGVHVAVTGRVLGPRQDPMAFAYTKAERKIIESQAA